MELMTYLAILKTNTVFTSSREGGIYNWRERAAFQRSTFGRSTAGNDVVATKNAILFFSSFLLRRDLFS